MDAEIRNTTIGDAFHASISRLDVGPLVDDTPSTISTHELERLCNESRTTVARGGSSSSPPRFESLPLLRSSNTPSRRSPSSSRSSNELQASQDETGQEQARVDCLRGVGVERATSRRSADPEKPTPTDSSEGEALQRSLDNTRRGLQKLKLRKIERHSTGHYGPGESTPNPTSLVSNIPFCAQRMREGANWFVGSCASKPLPHGFGQTEGLAGSSPSRNSGSSRACSSRSALLRLRNDRLPPGYAQPHEQPLFVGSASVPHCEVVGEMALTGQGLSISPSLDASSERQTAAPLISDPDEETDHCIPAPLSIVERPPPDMTIDTTMSGALPVEGEPSKCERRFSEVMEEFDGDRRPNIPRQSSNRPPGRNNTLTSDRGSVLFPIPEPPSEQETPAVESKSKSKSKEREKSHWAKVAVLVIVWAITVALTVFGISRVSPLDHHPTACTLEHLQTCTCPLLSFVHNPRLNATLPKAPQPYLLLVQPKDVQDLILVDGGVAVTSPDRVSSLDLRGALTMDTWLQGINLLSNIRYSGVIDGDANTRLFKKRLNELPDYRGAGHHGRIAKFASAQDVGQDNLYLRDEASSAQLFFAIWLGCLLAVELNSGFYSAIRTSWQCWLKPLGDVEGGDKSWKQDVLDAFGLAIRVVLACAFGTAAASGILAAFWT